MLTIDIYKHIDQAFDKNIVVFDSQAKLGELTDRLIGLMSEVMKNYYKKEMVNFLFRKGLDQNLKYDYYGEVDFSKIKFYEFPDEYWDKVEKYYKGSKADGDDHIVLALSEDFEEALLGSF